MSEIKGQILGIILTIGVFAAVFTALCTAFLNTSESIETKMDDALQTKYSESTD